jgi:DNA-binding PadR family transcriptional regulator
MRKSLPIRRNLWELTVLCLLREGSMHPYEMQRLIRQRNKDEFLELKRGSLYHNIGRLQRAGLIAVVETAREGRRPERTVYRITSEGEAELLTWLRDLLRTPGRDAVPFVAALSFLGHLRPGDALEPLKERLSRLESEATRRDAALRELTPRLGRLLVLEAEYQYAMDVAERAWVRALIGDLERGTLTWKPEDFLPNRPESIS